MNQAITVQNLCKTYVVNKHQNHVLKNINFSVEDGELALPVTTPDAVMPDYNAKIPEDELDLVGTKNTEELALLTVLTIPKRAPWDMTANLRAPILVNMNNRKAIQIIALNEEYAIRHVVFPDRVRETMQEQALQNGTAEED